MLSLVIPVYKNQANLPRLLHELEQFAAGFPGALEIVFVIDGSPDGSLRVLQAHLPTWPVRTQLVELSRNFGSFAAIAAGLSAAAGDTFAVIAADSQEPLDLVLEFHRLMSTDRADVVLGQRISRADPFLSRTLSNAFWSLYRRFVIKEMPSGGVDVFGCTRKVRDQLLAM